MRNRLFLPLISLSIVFAGESAGAQMGSPNTTPGAVVRVIHMRLKPGRADAFWADMRQHVIPVYEQEKVKGIISDYTLSTKVTTQGETDWNVAISILYPNWATLDDFGARTDPITLAHYGSVANRTSAAMARFDNAVTVDNYLIRRVTANPWK